MAPSNGLAVEDVPGIRDIGSSDREGMVCKLREAVAYMIAAAYRAVEALLVVVAAAAADQCSELAELQARWVMQYIPWLRARRAM